MEAVDGEGWDAENEGAAEVPLALPCLYQRALWAAKDVATPTKPDEEALVMTVDEAGVMALYVAVARVVMTRHELLTQLKMMLKHLEKIDCFYLRV
ncbi:hypothetical protein PC129_g18100 [Phytophthora cactorum]|uniref:Uncharacterized protein n=1 Tax=Phytophthora cactorum TaxID=29920 RepID=A0A8T1B5G7_9STRA|nr:hypothetical protein Pcac1_g3107 [Phytophthora cactorum]KAG2885021.1 hypothetical protein PC114_g19879 [Phytophthora cactorum]KAG2895347.1 hypothetical protein PC115_g17864 [Phytophthora cactorum]KAG3027816.1 hypothetical protein PC119_g7220 [Phytophthora cactorum]KAG3160427.1 hypothetical protein C6341_g13812 [Phytophthora cactorum]